MKISRLLTITPLALQELNKFAEAGCCTSNQCFSNAALAVTNFDLADRYVLCFVALGDDKEYGHAIVKIGGSYYDPTLQNRQLRNLRYRLHSEYTKQELYKLILQNQTVSDTSGGFAHVYPPGLRSNGDIVFESISGPDF